MSPSVDTVLRNATIYDGLGSSPYVGDVAISHDRIVEMGSVSSHAVHEIDCTGLSLAPGFVDVHTHDDWAVFDQPDMAFKTLQGVTTVVVGNCGTSAISPSSAWTSAGSYFEGITSTACAANVASFIGHGSLRLAVLGTDQERQPTSHELRTMSDFVERAMQDGALGLSTGLVYHPGRFAHSDEVVALAAVVANYDGLYSSHMRNEGLGLLDSVRETIDVGEQSGVRVQISHLKAYGSPSWGSTSQAIDIIRDAQARGIRVMADQYPYTRGSTSLEQIVSGAGYSGEPTPYGSLTGAQTMISSAPNHPEWNGKTIAEIGSEFGMTDRQAAEFVCQETNRACFVVTDTLSEDDVRNVMSQEFVMIGSDGIPTGDMPHPRLHHTFPRVLGHYVREVQNVTLADAIRRMTSMPCEYFGFGERGRLVQGCYADLVLFDAATIRDTGTYEHPTVVPEGIVGTWVNGRRVASNGAITGTRPGLALRH